MRSNHLSRRLERGFSFIEVLVVMGIIGVLVSGVVFIVGNWMEKRPQMMTRDRMMKVKVAIESTRSHFAAYPADDVTKLEKRWATGLSVKIKAPNNRTNRGIESVVQAFNWPGNPANPEFNDEDFVNTDEDEFGAPINPKKGTDGLEIKDEWDNPLIYIESQSYQKAKKNGGVEIMTADGELVRAMPYENEDGSFVNAASFQLFSMGPDMEPNTEDDVLVWKDD